MSIDLHSNAKGACLCERVQFEIGLPSLWCAHCHCSQCRRGHGAGYITWVGCAEEKFHFLQGETTVRWYRSSPPAQRGFCNHCGSSLFFRSDNWPGEIHIALANMQDPIDRAPQAHAYYSTHVDWLPIDSKLKILDG